MTVFQQTKRYIERVLSYIKYVDKKLVYNISSRKNKNYRKYNKTQIIIINILNIMTLWVIRAGKHGEQEHDALENNVCTIGWNELPNLSNIDNVQELTNLFLEHYENKGAHSNRNKINQIWKFMKIIKKGDMVALPLKSKPIVAIGKINGEYTYKKISDIIYHTRSVNWIEQIPRSNFDSDIKNSLGAFMTVGQVRVEDAEERITKMLEGAENITHDTSRLDPESIAMDNIIEIIERKFKGHDFTELIDSILRAKGFTTIVSPPGPDHGVDILASNGPLGFGDMSICIQVKSSKSPVSEDVIHQLNGVCGNFGAKYGLLVAWGGLTKPAEKEITRSFSKMQLWDQEIILEEIFENYDKLDNYIKYELPLKPIMVLVDDDEYSMGLF